MWHMYVSLDECHAPYSTGFSILKSLSYLKRVNRTPTYSSCSRDGRTRYSSTAEQHNATCTTLTPNVVLTASRHLSSFELLLARSSHDAPLGLTLTLCLRPQSSSRLDNVHIHTQLSTAAHTVYGIYSACTLAQSRAR